MSKNFLVTGEGRLPMLKQKKLAGLLGKLRKKRVRNLKLQFKRKLKKITTKKGMTYNVGHLNFTSRAELNI